MTTPHDPLYLAAIREAELSAVAAHYTEIAGLERQCARLSAQRNATDQLDEGS